MIGLESQGYHDETMVVRAMKAKALLYTYQLREKVKPLKPVIIIVLNLTGDKWKSPVTLKSMFEKEYLDKFGYLTVVDFLRQQLFKVIKVDKLAIGLNNLAMKGIGLIKKIIYWRIILLIFLWL